MSRELSRIRPDGRRRESRSPLVSSAKPQWDDLEAPESSSKQISFWKLSLSQTALMLGGTVGSFGVGFCCSFLFILLGQAINQLEVQGDHFVAATNNVSLSLFEMGLVTLALGVLQGFCFSLLGERVLQRAKKLYIRSLLEQRNDWFDEILPDHSDEVVMIFDEVQDAIGRRLGVSLQLLAQFVCCFILAAITDWKFTLILLPILPCIVLSKTFLTLTKRRFENTTKKQQLSSKNRFLELMSKLPTVLSLSGEQEEIEKYNTVLQQAEKFGVSHRLKLGIGTGLLFAAILLAHAAGVWFVAKRVAEDQNCSVSLDDCRLAGKLIGTFLCLAMGSVALGGAVQGITATQVGLAAVRNLFEAFEEGVDQCSKDQGGVLNVNQLQGRIEIEKLDFSYPSKPDMQIFHGLSLTIEPGETIGLVGPSGCGKSTLLNLILRFYNPDAGSLKFDGSPIKGLSLCWYRQQIGYVNQNPILFEGSISENIANGKGSGASVQEIEAAAIEANAHSFIQALPDGYGTEIGHLGTQLVKGQVVRIALARAIVRRPALLLVDDVTRDLDHESERLVQKALENVQEIRNRTTIIATSRLLTTKSAHRIAVIDNGRIIECGPHSELMSEDGVYRGLYAVNGEEPFEEEESFASIMEREVSISRSLVDPARQRNQAPLDLARRSVSLLQDVFGISSDDEDNDEENEISKVSGHRVFLTNGHFGHLALGLFGSLLVSAIYPLWGMMNAYSLDTVYIIDGSRIEQDIVLWVVLFCLLGTVLFSGSLLLHFGLGHAREKTLRNLRSKTFEAILQQEMSFFDKDENSPQELAACLGDNCNKAVLGTVERWGVLTQGFLSCACAYILALFFSWQLGLVMAAIFPFSVAGWTVVLKSAKPLSFPRNVGTTTPKHILKVAITGIRTVFSFNLQNHISNSYCDAESSLSKQRIQHSMQFAVALAISHSFMFFVAALTVYYSAQLIDRGKNTALECLISTTAFIYAANGIGQARSSSGAEGFCREAINKIFHIIDASERLEDRRLSEESGQKIRGGVRGKLEFRHVYFHYPSRPGVEIFGGLQKAEGLHLSFGGAGTIGVVGPKGCGKTTLMRLLLRLYSPQRGQIFLDRRDIAMLNLRWYRSQFTYIGPEPVLFSGTIRSNITYALQSAADEVMVSAAKTANAHEFIDSLEDKYETKIDELCTVLTKGQKQRLVIARAVARDSPILLLDEVMEGLDAQNEKLVQGALNNLQSLRQRTTLIATHRIKNVEHLDKIAVIVDGGVAEFGTHEELVNNEGRYADELKRMRDSSMSSV